MRNDKQEQAIRSSAAEYLTFVAATGDSTESMEMRYEDENIWLTQKMMSALYDVDVRTINEHIQKIYEDGELTEEATIRNFRIVQTEGSRQVSRQVKHYNLQMIIAVGFKVNNDRAVQFRKWANTIVKDYTIQGWAMDSDRLKNGGSRLLGIDSIDEYIRYGGTLRAGELAFDDEDVNAQDASFRDNESTRRYIDTAICKNIQHSLACYESGGHFRHLYSLYEAGELTSAINRIIEDMNHRFLISVLTDDFLSHDLRLTAANLRKERDPEKRTEALDAIDTEAVTRRLMELLDIRNKEEQSIGITTAHIIEIKQYLAALELIVDCPIESADPGIEPVEHILFTQPGMRYCQAQALVHSLLKDEQFSALSEYDKMQITGRILEEVRGRMMEDIVLLETMKAADKDHRVFKLQFEAGEFDMVIYDQKENSCEIFEIKHSSKQVPFQYRHLVDEDKCQRTERRFGPIQGRYILYRGEDAQMENGVQYWNVENYLKALPTLDIVQVQEIGMQSIEPTL